MRILLVSHGTRGDVQPIVALGVALRARGHLVQFVVPANFVTWIRSFGFHTQSDRIDVEDLLRSASSDLQTLSWQMRYLAHNTPLLFEPVARASEGCELIVCAGIQFAAASVAQWRNVPYAHLVFCPCTTPNSAAPRRMCIGRRCRDGSIGCCGARRNLSLTSRFEDPSTAAAPPWA
ncbi:MAG: glycosyltransferase [Steroidobacteraceae bacterium]